MNITNDTPHTLADAVARLAEHRAHAFTDVDSLIVYVGDALAETERRIKAIERGVSAAVLDERERVLLIFAASMNLDADATDKLRAILAR